MDESSRQRLIELEERMTYLEAETDALNQAVLARDKELKETFLAIEYLKNQVRELAQTAPADSENDPLPPHY